MNATKVETTNGHSVEQKDCSSATCDYFGFSNSKRLMALGALPKLLSSDRSSQD
jgi:hypothetical protein